MHCSERGQLLEAIRVRLTSMVDELLIEQRAVLAHAHEVEDTGMSKQQQHALLFARAAHRAIKTGLSDKHRLNDDLASSMQLEADQMRARLSVTSEQLSAAKQRLAELVERLDTPLLAEGVYDAFAALPYPEQTALEHRILMRSASGEDARAPALLPTLDADERVALFSHMLGALPEKRRLELLVPLATTLLPTILHKLVEANLMHHLDSHAHSPENAGVAIAAALRHPDDVDGTVLSPERQQLMAALHTALGGSAKLIEACAPEYHAAICELLPPTLAPPKGVDSDAFWREELRERDARMAQLMAQLEERAAQLAAAASQLKSTQQQLVEARGEEARQRKLIASHLAAVADGADHSLALVPEDGSAPTVLAARSDRTGKQGGDRTGDNPRDSQQPSKPATQTPSKHPSSQAQPSPTHLGAGAATRLTATLMRSYREELKHANLRIANLMEQLGQLDESLAAAQLNAATAHKNAQQAAARGTAAAPRKGCGQQSGSLPSDGTVDGAYGTFSTAGTPGPSRQTNGQSAHASARSSHEHGDAVGQQGTAGHHQGLRAAPGERESRRASIDGARREVTQPTNVPVLGQVQHKQRSSVPLGSVVLSLDGNSKQMSPTFLFRLLSNLTAAKLAADEKQLVAGQAPVKLAEFVSFQMIAVYGVRAIATRYLQEMVVGLKHRHRQHCRVSLFARGLQVFPDDVSTALSTEGYSMALRYLVTLLDLFESEKAYSRTTGASFFNA